MRRLLILCAVLCLPLPSHAGDVPVGRYRVELTSLKDLKEKQLIRQQSDFTCGSAALATILHYQYDDAVSEKEIIHTILRMGKPLEEARKNGFSLLDLKRYVTTRGLRGVGYAKMSPQQLMRYNAPVLVPVNIMGYNHFVVVRDVKDGQVFIGDPALGNMRMTIKDFSAVWPSGVAFYILPPEGQMVQNRFAATSQDYTFVTPERSPAWQVLRDPVILRHNPSDYILRSTAP